MQNNNNYSHEPFAEVIESSLDYFIAQSWKWDTFPPFGSLMVVATKQRELLALVYDIQTGSMEPNRYPFAYQKTEEELLKEQPQIFSFLKTTFRCLILGYQEKGIIHYTVSPEPPKIHAFIRYAQKDLLKTFFYHNLYMHRLFAATQHIQQVDELLLALMKQKKDLGILSEQRLHEYIDTFSLLTNNDYRRLKLFLQRAQLILQA